ncbi:MAG: hypothetical protein ACYS21_18220, partial [Planctomycetota bacterium]
EKDGVESAINAARTALDKVDEEFQSKDELREELASWGLDKYEDKDLRRVMDNLYYTLNDRQWLEAQFEKILATEDESAQLAHIDRIVSWEDPGPRPSWPILTESLAGRIPGPGVSTIIWALRASSLAWSGSSSGRMTRGMCTRR